MREAVRENIIKNVAVAVLLIPGYLSIQAFFSNPSVGSDKSVIGYILTCVSILAVTACFGNFAFTYEKVKLQDFNSRLLAHLTTGLLMLVIGLSLEMTAASLGLLIGNFFIFQLSLILLYFASVLYDFWDLGRASL